MKMKHSHLTHHSPVALCRRTDSAESHLKFLFFSLTMGASASQVYDSGESSRSQNLCHHLRCNRTGHVCFATIGRISLMVGSEWLGLHSMCDSGPTFRPAGLCEVLASSCPCVRGGQTCFLLHGSCDCIGAAVLSADESCVLATLCFSPMVCASLLCVGRKMKFFGGCRGLK